MSAFPYFRLAAISCLALLPVADRAAAAWVTIRNDSGKAIVIQETVVVNGQSKRCKPVSLVPGESSREYLSGPVVKKLDIFDGQNPKLVLWSGALNCKDELQTFSVNNSGGKVAVAQVPEPPAAPRK